MYLAQESTSETNRFDYSRKKPPRAKPSPTHRQGPLFADMLHESDPEQRVRAHHVCGSTTVYNRKGALRLYCGRRDCPVCFRRRYRKVAGRIRTYKIETENKLYWQRIDSWAHAETVRAIKSEDGDYVCCPVINKHGIKQEILISNIAIGSPVHTDFPRLETNLAVWTKTPEGRKISFSKGFRMKNNAPEGEKKPNFFARLSLPKILPYATEVGGTIQRLSKSYVKWEVDADKLTDKLLENDIVAYQITMVSTLFGAERDAEETIEAVPVNKKGKAVAQPVKLRHILNELYGTVLHNTSSVAPLLNDLTVTANSPPPG